MSLQDTEKTGPIWPGSVSIDDTLSVPANGAAAPENLFEALFMSSPIGICVIQEGLFKFVNPQFENDTGFSNDELLGEDSLDLVLIDDRDPARRNAVMMLKGQRSSPFQFRMVHKNGRIRWILGSISAFQYQGRRAALGYYMDVTDHKAMERKARENEERYLAVVENVTDAIAVNVGTKRAFVNSAFLTLHGLEDAAEVVGQPIDRLVVPEDRDMVTQRTLARQRGEAAPASYQYRIQRADGETRTVETSASVISFKGKSAVLAVIRDVTDQIAAQETLRRNEEQFRLLAENARDMIFRVRLGANEGFEYVSPAAYAMSGYTPEEWYENPDLFSKMLHPEDGIIYRETILPSLRSSPEAVARTFDVRWIRKDGRVIWTESKITVTKDEGGNSETAEGIIRDITDRKLAEESITRAKENLERRVFQRTADVDAANEELRRQLAERKKAESKLDKAYRRNGLILNSTSEGIYGVDLRGKTTFVNAAAGAMIGWDPEELIGKQQHKVFHHTKPDGSPNPGSESPIHAAFRDGLVHHSTDEVFWRKDGTSFRAEYTSTPVREGKEIVGAVVTFRDITERLELEHRRDAFISAASHELRTPMTTIVGFSELLLNRNPSDESRRKWVTRINTDSRRLTGIIDDLLNVSRIRSGKLTIQVDPVTLRPLLEEVVAGLRTTTTKHEFKAELPTNLPMVHADHDKLIQVFTNMLDNAVKYSPDGGDIVITGKHDRAGNRVVLTVADQGVGIDSDDLPRLFSSFERLERPEIESIGGTGLGLYVVKNLIELMGGDVWVESEPKAGSTFYLSLPVYRKRPEPRPSGKGASHD